jgi:glutathione synthase/RimK-type ligase-like ATP-grasp enzyme
LGNCVFGGGWLFNNGKFNLITGKIKMDLVYDRVGGITFPPENDKMRVVNNRDFKILAWDKWQTYQKLERNMPLTFWVGQLENAKKLVSKIRTEKIVVKPFNSLKGNDVYIGSKKDLSKFVPMRSGRNYILQEFVNTAKGIKGLTDGSHDLRVVIVNNKVVWSHIRVPKKGKFLANAAQGGTLTEIDYQKVPDSVKNVVKRISTQFYKNYDNPVFSLDFGINEKGDPMIFEINDQIGFPRWEMENRDSFLKALVENFKSKLNR